MAIKLNFGRFILPDEKLKCGAVIEGLKKGKVYIVISYKLDQVLVKNNKGVPTWYKTKFFSIC